VTHGITNFIRDIQVLAWGRFFTGSKAGRRAEKHRGKPIPGWLGFSALKVVQWG